MSADAKIWYDEIQGLWSGLSDWEDAVPCIEEYKLADTLAHIEEKAGTKLDWYFRIYKDGKIGLVGYQ